MLIAVKEKPVAVPFENLRHAITLPASLANTRTFCRTEAPPANDVTNRVPKDKPKALSAVASSVWFQFLVGTDWKPRMDANARE
jgi:hypothetical protein